LNELYRNGVITRETAMKYAEDEQTLTKKMEGFGH